MMQRSFHHHHRRWCRQRGRARAGFTLIEILTVLVIITIVVAIALPALSAARRKARNTRAAADLVAIKVAIEAYKTDFQDYPRPEGNNTGFADLGKALFSPGPSFGPLQPPYTPGTYGAGSVSSTGKPGDPEYQEYVAFGRPDPAGGFTTTAAQTDNTQWARFPVSDGADGAGFRARPGGKPYPPYLQEGKFRLRGLAILDSWDNPILYFTKRPGGMKAETGAATYVNIENAAVNMLPMYNAGQNVTFFMRHDDTNPLTAMRRMQSMMEQNTDPANIDGKIVAPEVAATTGPFLLWSAGEDGQFGPRTTPSNSVPTKLEIEKCDDITNFTTGQ